MSHENHAYTLCTEYIIHCLYKNFATHLELLTVNRFHETGVVFESSFAAIINDMKQMIVLNLCRSVLKKIR